MKKIFCIVLLLSMPTFSYANERESQIKTLMEAQGLLELFGNQIKMGEMQGKQMALQIMQRLMSQITPNEEYKNKLKSVFDALMKKMKTPWGEKEIIKVWTEYYGKQFSDEELKQLIAFYNSPIGKKEVSSTRVALVAFTKHFQKLGEPVFKGALENYIKELKTVAKACECKKTK